MSTSRKRIAIVGATSGIAEACARIWAEEGGRDFVLYGRRNQGLEAVAADLRVRDPRTTVTVIVAELTEPAQIDALVAQAQGDWPLDTVLIALGVLPDQAALQNDTLALAQNVMVNALAPVLWSEAFARAAGSKALRILVIGSVAGDRGRKSNYVYGAAKGLVERYIEGMQHRFATGGPMLVLIKPGPTRTAMTAHLDQSKMASVEDVAKEILAGVARGKEVIYTPRKWAFIMAVIRNLPRTILYRMNI